MNEATKAALKASEEANLAKDGEVSTMRRNIAKVRCQLTWIRITDNQFEDVDVSCGDIS
jgi:hypothetical protein